VDFANCLLLGIARYHPAFTTVARIGELQDTLHSLVNAWIATGEMYERVTIDDGVTWKETDAHDPQRRSLHENAPEFTGYSAWRSRLKFSVNEGGAGWKEDSHLTPELRGMENPRFQAYEIMRQLLMSSGHERFHIAKCTRCGVFFWRKSLSRAKRGLVCYAGCQNKRSSKDTRKQHAMLCLKSVLTVPPRWMCF